MTGRLNLRGQPHFGPHFEPGVIGTLTLVDASLKIRNPDYAFDHLAAAIDLTAGGINVTHLVAEPAGYPDASITLGAAIHPSAGTIRVSTDGQFIALPVSAAPPPAVPEIFVQSVGRIKTRRECRWRFFTDLLAAVGPASKHAVFRCQRAAVTLDDYALHLRPNGMSLSPAGWPDSISGITGQIAVTPQKIDLAQISANAGDISVQIAGTYLPPTKC